MLSSGEGNCTVSRAPVLCLVSAQDPGVGIRRPAVAPHLYLVSSSETERNSDGLDWSLRSLVSQAASTKKHLNIYLFLVVCNWQVLSRVFRIYLIVVGPLCVHAAGPHVPE